MNREGNINLDFAGGYVFGGVIIGALYWVLQALMDAYIFGDGHLAGQLFSPDSYNIWMRTMVVSLLVFASAYVQSVVSRRKRAEKILKEENSFKRSLIKNAAEAMVSGGIIHIRTQYIGHSVDGITMRREKESPGHVEVLFEDDGPGIPEDLKEKLFDPYVSSKKGNH